MSSPGMLQPDSQADPQQQPLFGQPVVDPQMLAMRRLMAQQMQSPDKDPIYNPYQAIHHMISPVVGQLIDQRTQKQQADMQNGAAGEFANIMHSQDPVSAMAGSKNPLVRQMIEQMMPGFIKNYQDTQGAVSKATALGPIDAKNKGLEAAATEPYEAKKAVDIATGTAPIEVKKAADIEAATFPLKALLQKLGQAPTYAGQAETARHNRVTEGQASDKLEVTTGGYKPPWEH